MPYITTEQVKEKRNEIKKAFPNLKISVRRENGSTIDVSILEGNIDMMAGQPEGRDYVQVNTFYIEENYSDRPEIMNVLSTINKIAKKSQRELVYDGDYGSVPTFYASINIGKWNQSYKKTA